jgi:hypothetical protein
MGKISGQFTSVLFAGENLSGRSRQVDFAFDYEEEEATAFQDGAINSQAGMAAFEGNVTSYLDPSEAAQYVGQSFRALRDNLASAGKILMVLFGDGAVADEGDWAVVVQCTEFSMNGPFNPREKVMLESVFKSEGYVPQVGLVGAFNEITTSFTGDTVDLGGVLAAGLNAYLIVYQDTAEDTPGTDTYSFKVQHNTLDNGSWVDYITFSADGSARVSERQTSVASVNRYVRVTATVTGSALDVLKFAVVIAPNEDW